MPPHAQQQNSSGAGSSNAGTPNSGTPSVVDGAVASVSAQVSWFFELKEQNWNVVY